MKTKKVSDEFKKGENSIGYVDSSFTSEFGDKVITPGTVMQSVKLTKYMKDSEIIKEFNIQECTLGDVLATLNSATDDMKDGYSNIFYIKGHSRVVLVYWSDVGGLWGVFAWRRDDRDWVGGGRVFSPATVSITRCYDLSIFDTRRSNLTLDEAIRIVKAAGMKITKEVITIEEV